jgi:amino acid transporter
MEQKPSLIKRLRTLLIGRARSLSDKRLFHKLSLTAFFAWIGLGADGLTSSCYGPSEAFSTLGTHHALGLFVALGTALTILVVSESYTQIIELFPSGGGGYLVASKLISPTAGMVSGCALIIDYVLTISVSIASGADALFSFLPPAWYPYKLAFGVGGIVILLLLNLRGVRESVVPLAPIFLVFILTHAFAIVYALSSHASRFHEVTASVASDVHRTSAELGLFGMLFLIMRSYSMGAGTYTGIEAVSNGLPILREPREKTGKRTMRYMSLSLAFTVVGLMFAYLLYSVSERPGKTLNAVFFESMTVNWGSTGSLFVLVTLFSEAALLFVAAQTGLLGGPRVLANMALDRWVPSRFGMLSDRLVTQNGIVIMGGAALVTMLLSKGSVRLLVVLYSINVFITFTLAQIGMVRHWWMARAKVPRWKRKLAINSVGCIFTGFILISVTVIKFHEGGWVTLLVTGTLVILTALVKRHYYKTAVLLRRLQSLVEATALPEPETPPGNGQKPKPAPKCDPNAKTAVLFVNGFNGLGLHTLFSVIRAFGGQFKNYVFAEVGLIDAGNFKGTAEIELLKEHTQTETGRYVGYMRKQGFYAEACTAFGTDIVDEAVKLAPKILKRFPNSIFFGGQLIFTEDSFISRWLHNYTIYAMQRRLHYQGIPVIIMPIRLDVEA